MEMDGSDLTGHLVSGRIAWHDLFHAFDSYKDITVGQFVALCPPPDDPVAGTIFYIAKVRALEQAATNIKFAKSANGRWQSGEA